jgi:hypothetical protein
MVEGPLSGQLQSQAQMTSNKNVGGKNKMQSSVNVTAQLRDGQKKIYNLLSDEPSGDA